MFTLVLCFPRQGSRPRSELSITSGHIPQKGSTITTQAPRFGTWDVDHIGYDTDSETLSNTVYVYLKETD